MLLSLLIPSVNYVLALGYLLNIMYFFGVLEEIRLLDRSIKMNEKSQKLYKLKKSRFLFHFHERETGLISKVAYQYSIYNYFHIFITLVFITTFSIIPLEVIFWLIILSFGINIIVDIILWIYFNFKYNIISDYEIKQMEKQKKKETKQANDSDNKKIMKE